jgi:hypothetical protein
MVSEEIWSFVQMLRNDGISVDQKYGQGNLFRINNHLVNIHYDAIKTTPDNFWLNVS